MNVKDIWCGAINTFGTRAALGEKPRRQRHKSRTQGGGGRGLIKFQVRISERHLYVDNYLLYLSPKIRVSFSSKVVESFWNLFSRDSTDAETTETMEKADRS